MNYHLAQLNIARMKGVDIDDPIMASFVAQLDEVNAIAEASPGFMWRLKDDVTDNATHIAVFPDKRIIVNMSVWESVDALKAFAYSGRHLEVFAQRKDWFKHMVEAHMVLWWVPIGHVPSPEEAKERLEHLQTHGPSAHAFTFGKVFQPQSSSSEG